MRTVRRRRCRDRLDGGGRPVARSGRYTPGSIGSGGIARCWQRPVTSQDAGKPLGTRSRHSRRRSGPDTDREMPDAYRAAVNRAATTWCANSCTQMHSPGGCHVEVPPCTPVLAGEAEPTPAGRLRPRAATDPRARALRDLLRKASGSACRPRARYAAAFQSRSAPRPSARSSSRSSERNGERVKADLRRLAEPSPPHLRNRHMYENAGDVSTAWGLDAPAPSGAELDKIEKNLETLWPRHPEHAARPGATRTIETRARGLSSARNAEFDELLKKGGDEYLRVGALFMHAVAGVLAAGIDVDGRVRLAEQSRSTYQECRWRSDFLF